MTRGRKPIPTVKLKATGGYRNDRHGDRADEPQVESGTPTCPRHLSAEARKQWHRIVERLAASGIITMLDCVLLELYCEVYADWRNAKADIRKRGRYIKNENGNQIPNPYISTYNKSIDNLKTLGASLGMDPSSRTKIRVEKPKREDDPKMKFFKTG